jgi:hypothetical protein
VSASTRATDPITKKRHELIEIVPAGPNVERDAEAVRVRFVHEINERKNPKTNATVSQLLEKYLAQFQGSPNTLQLNETHVKSHIKPLIGDVKIGRLKSPAATEGPEWINTPRVGSKSGFASLHPAAWPGELRDLASLSRAPGTTPDSRPPAPSAD